MTDPALATRMNELSRASRYFKYDAASGKFAFDRLKPSAILDLLEQCGVELGPMENYSHHHLSNSYVEFYRRHLYFNGVRLGLAEVSIDSSESFSLTIEPSAQIFSATAVHDYYRQLCDVFAHMLGQLK